jgi:hypothetical protein
VTLPAFDNVVEMLEFLYNEARAHQIANDERPQFTVHPTQFEVVERGLLREGLRVNRVMNPHLGEGLQGPNYQLFADRSLDENELDVVRVRDSGVR